MSMLEDQLRETLAEMSGEVRPVPMLTRLDHSQARWRRRSRSYGAIAVAAAVVLILVAGSLLLLRPNSPNIVPPVHQPPKVLRLSSAESVAPGRTALLLVVADNTSIPPSAHFTAPHLQPAYALPIGGHRALRLKESDVDPTWTDQLSLDGTRVVRELTNRDITGYDPKWPLEIVNLQTGNIDDVRGAQATCPMLSPDNRTLAGYSENDVVLIDVSTGAHLEAGLRLDDSSDLACYTGFAWSPDGSRIVVPHGPDSVVLDRRGRQLSTLTELHVINASMSWSPDGRLLLLYDAGLRQFVARDMEERADSVLRRPRDAVTPLGWAGSRIVWLAGQVGEQQLITTDGTGGDPRPWIRLDTNGLPIESVTWSSDLAGTAR